MVRLAHSPILSAAGALTGYTLATSVQSARVVAAAAQGAATVAGSVAGHTAGQLAAAAGDASTQAAARLPKRLGSALDGLADIGAHRRRRRVWTRDGRAHVEVKGMTGRGERHRRMSSDLMSALTGIEGVHWAQVNAVTREVLLAFDEGEVDFDQVMETIEAVEEEHGTAHETFSRDAAEHPGDDGPVTLAAVTLAVDLAGLGVAVIGQFAPVALLPRGARIPVVFAETYPRLRHALEHRFGRAHTELLLSVSNSAVNAVTHGPAPLVIDSFQHLLRLGEARARNQVWHRREHDLVGDGSALPGEAHERLRRPWPFPEGPVERLGDRTALASLLGAGGALAFTRDPGRAADLMLATMPKAARQGRDAFGAVLGRELTRRGVVPMDPSSLRRLDRVSAVIIDSAALCGDRVRILSATALSGLLDDDGAWRAAERLVEESDLAHLREAGPWVCGGWRFERARDAVPGEADGPTALTLDVLDEEGTRHARVRIGCELDPLADALLAAARAAVDRMVLTEHDSADDLLPWADETVPFDEHVRDHVHRLQAEGHGVLLVSTAHDAALDAADVGVAVLGGEPGVGWSADLICGPGLAEAWRVLRAVRVARQVSERSSRLALGGSALGALLATTGSRRSGRRPGLSPVHSASLIAILGGGFSAYRIGRLPAPQPVVRGNWHALSAQETYTRLRAHRESIPLRPSGNVDAALRIGQGYVGSLASVPVVSRLLVRPARGTLALGGAVAEELRDPLTPVLAFGAAASAVVGSGADALLVGGVMAGNAVISASQRLRAERALRRLLLGERISARRLIWPGRPRQEAWPAGLERAPTETVEAGQLRVGDVILLRASDIVPADARLIRVDELEVDESALTGESLPVAKSTAATPGADLGERTCMLYEGCTVLAGTGYAIVVAVGAATEAGRAAAVAGSFAPPAGIQARLGELTRVALPAAGIGGMAVTGLAMLRGVPLRQAVASGVAIAVAAVPEGLPLVATVAQFAAARRLSGHGVLVRSSRTLEALGRVDTLCFDKTGTLTEGRLSVTRVAAHDRDLPFGDGHARHLLRVAARACPPADGATARAMAHATDTAVAQAAQERLEPDDGWKLTLELPFETNRGYAASLGAEDGVARLAVKGAPEMILDRCDTVLSPAGPVALTPARRRTTVATVQRLAEDGLRVLAVAEADPGPAVPSDVDGAGVAALVGGLTLVGFVAIADAPRPCAPEAVRRLTEAGVRITMITGDHPVTARAVARRLGIPGADEVTTGAELDRLPKARREARIAETTVFARVSPEHKVRIVQALQRAGHVVAMTGDGSNDAAAIRLADVGIALAGKGSVSARNAAGLVLTDPDPNRIVDALAEGRALWGNVRDAVSILVGGNAGEIAFTVLGTAVSGRAPLGTRQLLLVNMLTDMLPALAVALAPAKPGASGEEALAAGPVAALWGPALARNLAIRGGATALGATLAWQTGRMTGRARRASTMGLGALVGTQLGQTLVTGRHSPLVIGTSLASAAALFAIVETPGVSRFFGCTPLGPFAWAVVAGSSATATLASVAAPALLGRHGVSVA